MNKPLMAGGPASRNEHSATRKLGGHWLRIAVSMIATLSAAILIVGCGSGGGYSNNVPVVALTSPTATTGTTSVAATETTPTATTGATPTVVPGTAPTGAMSKGTTPTAMPAATSVRPTPTSAPAPTLKPTAVPVGGKTVTAWIQTTDSCKQALAGATFTVTGPGISTTTAATAGSTPIQLGGAIGCPIQEGSCSSVSTGCTSAALPIPTSGTATYKIVVARTANGRQGLNYTFAICEGGSDCRHGPEVATVLVSASGSISATVLNPYPDGTTIQWPTNKAAYGATLGDPIMFHEFGISQFSNAVNQCDGDHDADDYLTGTPGQHCDSDADRH